MEKLKTLVENSRETKETIAKTIGVSAKQLHRYCTGEQEPTASKIKAICKYFQISADELLDMEESTK